MFAPIGHPADCATRQGEILSSQQECLWVFVQNCNLATILAKHRREGSAAASNHQYFATVRLTQQVVNGMDIGNHADAVAICLALKEPRLKVDNRSLAFVLKDRNETEARFALCKLNHFISRRTRFQYRAPRQMSTYWPSPVGITLADPMRKCGRLRETSNKDRRA